MAAFFMRNSTNNTTILPRCFSRRNLRFIQQRMHGCFHVVFYNNTTVVLYINTTVGIGAYMTVIFRLFTTVDNIWNQRYISKLIFKYKVYFLSITYNQTTQNLMPNYIMGGQRTHYY